MSSKRTIPQHIITEHRRDGSMGRKYQPLKLIGQGGSAIAFSAKVLDITGNPTSEICLLKEFFPSKNAARDDDDSIRVLLTDSNKALKKQFLYEVSAGYAASEHIYGTTTALSSFESEKKNTYIIMPYEKHGMSLELFCDWLRKNGKTVPVRAWARLFYKLTDRVRNLHEKAKMLHSDISIGNVMIMQSDDPNELYDYVCDEKADYTVIILDFGCAYFKNDEDSEADEDNVYAYNGSDILTAKKRDVVFTTEEFASQELLKDTHQEITSYSDIYSVVACFKYCINAVASGDKYIFSADIPSTVKAQINKILGILNADESEYIYKARVLMEMFDELIRRIDGKGVSKAILWETGNRDIAAFKRSADFDIVDRILPSGRKSVQQMEYAHLDGGETRKLQELISETKGSTYLIGEGGIGKTTSLIHYANGIYQKGYTEESVVPVYIELGNCTMNNAGLSSKLIHRYILSRMTGAALDAISVEQIRELDKLFIVEKSQPEYILMLDGLNEVSEKNSDTKDGSVNRPIVTLLIYEITQIIQNCKNVRVILTSRNDNESLSDSSFQRIYITGLNDEEVKQYLDDANISDEKRQAAKNNPALMEILFIPLFLSIYTRIADNIDATELSTRGELLKAFFNEKRKDIYTQINRVDRLHNLPLEGEQYAFILTYVLPQMCWKMVRNRTMELDSETIYELIDKALSNDNPMYIGFGLHSTIRRTAASLKQDKDEAVKNDPLTPIFNAIKDTLSVFYKKSEDEETKTEILRIRHQHFRDYFAALYFIGLMKSARSSMARRKDNTDEAFGILQEIRDEVIMPDVLVFVGEILGEHKNAPVLVDGKWTYNVPELDEPQDRNLIKRTFDVFRVRVDGSVGYGVYNLVEILKRVRRELFGENLSWLDLRKCTFEGVKLGEKGCGASLKGSLLEETNILPVGHSSVVNSASYSPDGKYIVSSSWDRTIKVWDAFTFTLVKTLEGHSDIVNSVSYSTDGKYIVSASNDETVKVWDASTFSIVSTLEGHSDCVNSASYSPDGRYIVSASGDETVKVWDACTFDLVKTLEAHSDEVNSASYSPDGKYIVSASVDETVKVWDATSFALVKTLENSDIVNSASYSPYGEYIVSVSWDETVKVWDATSFALVKTLDGHMSDVSSATYSPDGKFIVSASEDTTIKVWDASTFALVKTFEGHSSAVYSASYSPDGKFIVSASEDTTIKVWDASTFALVKTLEGYSGAVYSASFSPEGRYIVSASGDKTVKVWDDFTFAHVKTLEGHSGAVYSASYSPDGRYIVSASHDKTAKVWDASTYALVKTLEGHSDCVSSATYSRDGKYIVSSSWDRTIKVWDASTFALVNTLEGHSNWVESASYSPDGRYIVSASWDKTVKVWDASTFVLVKTLDGHSDWVNCATYRPDGKYIISASGGLSRNDNTIKVWNTSTFELIATLKFHWDSVKSASYSPDGKYIVSASSDESVTVWDASTFFVVQPLDEHSSIVNSASYSSDGKYIVSASDDGTIKVWDALSFECVDTIPNIPGLRVIGVDMRNLHPDSHFSEKDKKILKQYGAIID